MSDPDGLRAGVEKLIAEWEKEEAAAKSSASEAARMHFSGGSFERHMAVAKSAKSHADELRALLAKHPPTLQATVSDELCERCEGNGVLKIKGGVQTCPACKGKCWKVAASPPSELSPVEQEKP